MKIGKVVRERALLPKLGKKPTVAQRADSAARAEFLLRRARQALVDNPSWKGASDDEVTAANVGALRTRLAGEVTSAATKVTTLRTAMADATRTELVAIDDASVDPRKRFRRLYMSLVGATPQQLRDAAIITSGWLTLAADPTIADADLHTLVSRRLMTTERMMWYVGRPEDRSWDFAPAHHKEWQDGWNRIFEYPRLPVMKPFRDLCKPAPGSTTCDPSGQMPGWEESFGAQFNHALQVNPTARPVWKPADKFFFDKGGGANDPVQAILDLFTASKRFDERNLLMCDHVICCLHLEALARVKSKRDGNRTWLKTITDAKLDGWLRIIHPSLVDDDPSGAVFLVGEREPRFFERRKIAVDQLMVGDHVIVFNHPAYVEAKETVDVWKLENALVVATWPRLLLQGHGTHPLPFTSTRTIPVKDKTTLEPSMRLNMLTLFNRKLDQLRSAAVAENKKASPRSLMDDFDSDAVLVQRTDVGPYSGYDPAAFSAKMAPLARWWIRWNQDDEQHEPRIAADPAWAQQTWDKHRVELTDGFGYFPLWLPRLDKAGKPVRKAGKISALDEVVVAQKMAAGWSWYYAKDEAPDDAAAHRVAARRPKVN